MRSLSVSLEKSTEGPAIGLEKYEGEEYWTQDQKATTYMFPKSPIAIYRKICIRKDFEDWNLGRRLSRSKFCRPEGPSSVPRRKEKTNSTRSSSD